MSLDPKVLANYVADQKTVIQHNKNVFNILEGDLMTQLQAFILAQTKVKDSAKLAIQRAAPINVLKKINDKLTRLYENAVVRKTESSADQELIGYYETLNINSYFGDCDYNTNGYKNTVMEMYYDPKWRLLRHRSVPSNLFLPYSDDKIDPLRMTAIIKFMGEYEESPGVKRSRYWAYSDTEFLPFDDKGNIINEDLIDSNGKPLDGSNPWGVIPFSYVNQSRNLLVPMIDIDQVIMTLLIPCLYTDLNYASKFLSNPIIYGSNLNIENFEINPSVFLDLGSSDENDKDPDLKVLRAEPDIQSQLNMIASELGAWLETKNIRPGSIGKLTVENYASGIALAIGELDTSTAVKKQGMLFQPFEGDTWKRTAQIHNYLVENGDIEEKGKFSEPKELNVTIEYSDQKPFETKIEKAQRLKIERDSGLNSKKGVLREYHPNLGEKGLKKLMEEIEEDKTLVIVEPKEESEE